MISDRDYDDCSLSVCANCKGQPKKGRDLILSIVHAVNLHGIEVLSAKERTGISISLLVGLWTIDRAQRTFNCHKESCTKYI